MNAITTAGEAFFVAAEMERRAVRLYERALLVFEGSACQALMREILSDEREHLCRFRAFGEDAPFDGENAALLSAESAQIIFSGGLTEAHRLGAFKSRESLLRYAAAQERAAIAAYTRFAEQLGEKDARAEAFYRIAQEETKHLASLEQQLGEALQTQKE